jgi:hypothetical protein
VQTFVIKPLPSKIERFHRELRDAGLLQDLGAPAPAARTPPLRATAAIASKLRERIHSHRQG